MRISMENSQQEFQVDIDESFDPWVMGDARRIRQVLVNILENASKYTGRGEKSPSLYASLRRKNSGREPTVLSSRIRGLA